MTGLSLTGLASGIDTDGIVSQLMAVERLPRQRLALQDTREQGRQTILRDLASKLNAVRDAANALKSTTTWANVQSVTSSDSARIAVSSAAGAAPGTRLIEVSALAVTAQHAFTYTSSALPQTIAIGTYTLNVAGGDDAATVAAAINDDDAAPVSAVVAAGKLVFTSRTSGAGGDFTVDATPLLAEDAVYARAGRDAAYTIDGVPDTSPSNVVSDAILGVDITLKATTSAPVTIAVGDPAPDKDAVKAKLQTFVTAYNGAVDFIRGKLAEKTVKDPQTNADALKGMFAGDSMLTNALSSMRSAIGDLSSYGISTGAASASGTVNPDSVAGRLTIDATKLSTALAGNTDALRTALDGLGQRVSDVVTPVAGTRVDERLSGVDATRKRLADAMAAADVRLAGREKTLRAKFAAMEAALAASQAAQAQFSSQLAGLSR